MQKAFSEMWDKLQGWIDTFIVNLPNLLVAIIVFVLAMFLGHLLSKYTKKLLRKTGMQTSVRRLISTLITITLVILGLVLAIGILNLDMVLKTVLTGAGIAGLVIGLALQGTLADSFAGIVLAFKQPLHVGDWIESNNYSGYIEDINLRNTKLKDNDNNIIIIPNRLVIDNPAKNYSVTSRSRVIFTCGVTYDAPLRKVMQVTREAIAGLYDNMQPEEVEFLYTGFGDYSIDFRVRFWIDAIDNVTILKARSNAILALKESFDEHGITIPFPIRTLEFNTPLELDRKDQEKEESSDQ